MLSSYSLEKKISTAALGCLAGAWLVRYVPTEAIRGLWEAPAGTLFRMTLTEPYWFGGGFLRQGCIGLALMLLGLLMPSGVHWTREIPPEKPTESAEPETFVALLPGEEPMVVEIPAEDAEIDDELHHLPPEDEVEEIDGSPEEENPENASQKVKLNKNIAVGNKMKNRACAGIKTVEKSRPVNNLRRKIKLAWLNKNSCVRPDFPHIKINGKVNRGRKRRKIRSIFKAKSVGHAPLFLGAKKINNFGAERKIQKNEKN